MSGKRDMEQNSSCQQANISKLYQGSADMESAYICARIEGQIAYYEAKSARNKTLYYALSALTIIANALVPVCSVFLRTVDGDEGLKMLIAALSSFALVSTSLLALFNAKELWAKYRSSAASLTSLLHQYYTRSGIFEGIGGQEAFRLLTRMAETHFDEENKAWSELLSRSAKPESGAQR